LKAGRIVARKPLLIGNWKLHHTRKSAADFFLLVLPHLPVSGLVDLAIAPVTPMLDFVGQKIAGHGIALASQNVFYEKSGAFTGEWSAEQLAELSVKYCLVGHSERRQIFGETDEDVEKKAKACVRVGIMPVICVGESKTERERGRTADVITRQVRAVVQGFKVPLSQELTFAYEPIWAIGTGVTATPYEAQEVHRLIRQLLADGLGPGIAGSTRILYGGSVTALNIKEIVSMPDVDGALVGGASLQVESFLTMVRELQGAGLA
jgi:triosephosphate isomerase